MISLGFTGTRHGLTRPQALTMLEICTPLLNVTAHHGDCLGADAQFHRLCIRQHWRTHGHPPDDDTHRAFCTFDTTDEPLPYLLRNDYIVKAATLMLAAPFERVEQARGGTWSTIRTARRLKVPLVIVFPDGTKHGEWTV